MSNVAPTLELASLDLGAFAEQGAKLELHHPIYHDQVLMTGEGDAARPVTLTLLGADSATHRQAMHAIANRQTNDRTARKGKRREFRAEDVDESAIELLAELTRGWDGIALDGQDPYPFTRDNAKTLYRRFLWIREQVVRFVEDRANFFETSENGSSPPSSIATTSSEKSLEPTPS